MEITVLIITIFLSGILSSLFSCLIGIFSPKYKIFDHFKDRNHEDKEIPRIGGVILFLSFLITLLFVRVTFPENFKDLDLNINSILLSVAVLIIFFLGAYDDLKGANAWKKLTFQTIAAVLIYTAGIKIAEISIPFIGTKSLSFHILPFFLTILWVVGITNAVNILDGLDGLAVGVSFFAAFSLGVLALLSFQHQIVIIIAALLGAMIGFYPFNFPRAKIFLGDSGSLLIGFALAVLSMAKIHRKASLAVALMIPIIILFLPILETIVTIIRRTTKKAHIFKGDKDHLHYRFLRKGFSETKTTLVLIFISFLFSLSGILIEFVQRKMRFLIFILIFFICFLLLSYLGYISINSKKAKRVD